MLAPLELIPILSTMESNTDPKVRAKEIQDLHGQVKKKIATQKSKCPRDKLRKAKTFKKGNLLYIRLKERFPEGAFESLDCELKVHSGLSNESMVLPTRLIFPVITTFQPPSI